MSSRRTYPLGLPKSHTDFVASVTADLESKITRNKTAYEKLASDLGIMDQNTVKELTELAITIRARQLAHQNKDTDEIYNELVDLYKKQVNLSHRTSQSILLQQYSTPAPISYLAGIFAGAHTSISIFEPCAGNGLLTIAARENYTTVNEIDATRLRHLKSQGYFKVLSQDAGKPFTGFEKKFESVLTNPPFGRLDEPITYGTFGIKTLEHMMVINALNCMADNGRAAVIVGGHATYDTSGRIKKGANRVFLNYLYHHYNVLDVINIDGKKLYSRQGTGFNVRLILIDGRKVAPEGHAPLFNPRREAPVNDFNDLYHRVMLAHNASRKPYEMTLTEFMNLTVSPNVPYNTYDRVTKFKREHFEMLKQKVSQGYFIEKRVRDIYPQLQIEINKTMNSHSENELDRQARELMNRLDQEIRGEGLSGAQGKEQLYLMRFTSETPPHKEYEAFAKFYSLQQAQRFAQNLAVDLSKREPPLYVNVTSVRPWLQWFQLNGLGAPYMPTSDGCIVLDTVVPDSMSFETHEAMRKVADAVGGDIDEFVRNRLGYPTKIELCSALAAEQIDAVALAIYNIEARKLENGRGQAMIIGDQTGIGKGRVAAAMIRYAVKQGNKPIFLTEKPNLFTDLYRDLKAIGSPHLVPFIINAKDAKSTILDERGEKIYTALEQKEQDVIFNSVELPSAYDFIMATYSQFNSPNKPKKRNFLYTLAANNLIILDEAHNASGAGNTGAFIQEVVEVTKGALFLSATFAKRPDNMPLYAMKTVLRESNMSKDELVTAIRKGGVALQEIIASELVKEGQMLRRERSFEGVEVNYVTLYELEQQHRATADAITEILRDIIDFQKRFILGRIKQIDKELAKEHKAAEVRAGTQRAGADMLPYFSKVFQVIHQMLFAVKAEAVADRAIMRLREGKKPVIAFSSTMGAFLEDIESIEGEQAKEGDIISADFAEVLRRGLKGINRYTENDIDGNSVGKEISIESLGGEAQLQYQKITNKIEAISTGITISPIDVIVERIRNAGFTVAEVTGRKYYLELLSEESISGLGAVRGKFPINIQNLVNESGRFGPGKQLLGRIKLRKRIVTNEAFRKFNNNEIDVLLINQAGSTGASAHAIPTDVVPPEEVKQRVMIVLQAELDISTEVQKRGRINRTGQILKPIYDYVSSAIPAEQRLMMMLQSKLKSLDANTTSNQKQSKKILDVPDFLNKYGDILVEEYLEDNSEVNELLDKPLDTENYSVSDAALKVTGRVAVLSTQMQQDFYEEMTSRYNDYTEYLKQTGEYDLEVERLELKAKTITEEPIIMGKGGASTFGTDSVLENVEADVLRKPMLFEEVYQNLMQALSGKTAAQQQSEILHTYLEKDQRHLKDIAAIEQQYDELLQKLPEEKWLLKVRDTEGESEYQLQFKEEYDKIAKVREEKIDKIFKKHADLRDYLERVFKFFYVGRTVNYIQRFDDEGFKTESHPAIFLGFVIDPRKKNPYALSNIKLRFAIATSLRYLAIPASDRTSITSAMGASYDVTQHSLDQLEDYWERSVASRMKNREYRYIVTGNILQALGKFQNGRLISYTTDTAEEKKGILMPENWEDEATGTERHITVPASKALPIIKSLGEGHEITIGKNISIFRQGGRYKILVPASKSSGGDIYLNPRLLTIVDGNNFNKVSDTMVAVFDHDQLEEVLTVIEQDIGTSVTVTKSQFRYIKEYYPDTLVVNNFPRLHMLPEVVDNDSEQDLLIEAEALLMIQELELELLRMESDRN
jgi:hypothetical protein